MMNIDVKGDDDKSANQGAAGMCLLTISHLEKQYQHELNTTTYVSPNHENDDQCSSHSCIRCFLNGGFSQRRTPSRS